MPARMTDRLVTGEQLKQSRFRCRAVTEIAAHHLGKRARVVTQQPVKRRKTSIPLSAGRIRIAACSALHSGKTHRQRISIIHAILLNFLILRHRRVYADT
jgi:hypothetical protein